MGKRISLNQIAKTQTYKYRDVVIDSSELKKIVKHRIKELNLKLFDVTKQSKPSSGTSYKHSRVAWG
jgi:6-pyruvoyl-tetrahydropterin synthase